MAKTIYAVYSSSPFGYHDCLMLVSAESCSNAVEIAIAETTITDDFCEDNICAQDLGLQAPEGGYMKIFANDISYK